MPPPPPLLASVVDSVTVFRKGALVRRVADLSGLDAAVRRVRFGPLPIGADDDSVRVSAACTPTEMRVVLATMAPQEHLAPPEDAELLVARAEELRIEANIEAHRQSIAALQSIAIAPRRHAPESAPNGIPHEARMALIELRRTKSELLHAKIAELSETLRTARLTRQALEQRLHLASTARQTRAHELRKAVDVSFDTSPTGTLAVEYLVGGACWCPTYALRLDEELASGSLEMRGLVAQRSGEDWTGAQLVLSTARPHTFVDLPEATSIRIGRQQPPPSKTGWRSPPAGADALFADADRAYSRPPAPARTPPPRVEPAPRPPAEVAAAAALFAVTDGANMPVGGAAPMPPPQMGAPPMPPPPPPPGGMRAPAPMPSRRGGRAEAKKKAKGAPPSFGGAAPPMLDDDITASHSFDEGGGGAGAAGEVDAAAAMLAYGSLRMAALDEPGRGTLHISARAELYMELLVAEGRVVEFDIHALVQTAMTQSSRIDPPPAGTQFPSSVDGFDHSFEVADRVDVLSDGAFHGLPVWSETAAPRPFFVTVPREADDVFRFVEMNNPIDGPILPGPLDVYVGGKYLLGRDLSVTPRGAKLELGLGVEQGIKVARNTRFEEQSAGLMGRALELEHTLEIDLENHTSREVRVEVRERIPVARDGDDDVEVKVESVEPAWEPWEPTGQSLEGGHRWIVSLAPSAKRSLRATYVVRISAKHELVGGNRRD